jgi:hypothetical protein
MCIPYVRFEVADGDCEDKHHLGWEYGSFREKCTVPRHLATWEIAFYVVCQIFLA